MNKKVYLKPASAFFDLEAAVPLFAGTAIHVVDPGGFPIDDGDDDDDLDDDDDTGDDTGGIHTGGSDFTIESKKAFGSIWNDDLI